ncbi:MAG: hypothetical protein FWC51_04940 [Proteobacteria bacterium]|nr:hypothetical protein [Pseudomonadota bacterium]
MSRQIQIRRGNSAENNAFTGAVGEITMDTDAKTLRVHDGATRGGTTLARMTDVAAAAGAGAAGPQGAQGARGFQGYQGVAGASGPQGAQGAAGVGGTSFDLDYAKCTTLAATTVVTSSPDRHVLIITCADTVSVPTGAYVTINGVSFKLYSEYTGTDYPHLSQGYFPIGIGDSYSFSGVQNAVIRKIPYKSV